MLPGHIAGHYTYDDCHVDLSLLATFAKARLVVAKAENIDLKVRHSTHLETSSLNPVHAGLIASDANPTVLQ